MNDKEYIDYINAELSLFSNECQKINKIDLSILKMILERKRYFQSKMMQDYIKKYYMFRNTNINHEDIEEGIFKISYDYQRYDIEIKQKNFLKFFYNLEAKNYYYYFTNCGMSALFSCFSSFRKNNYDIDRLSNIYVEIERMIDDYIQKENNSIGKVLYIDSSSYEDLNEILKGKDLSNYSAFIFDTTDYLADGLSLTIKELSKYKKSIYLIRSHIKLDMLGSEWNKLGSVCVIHPEKISKCDKKISDKIKNDIEVYLSVIGGFAYPENLPLIWNNPKFNEINKKRIEIIKKNSEYLYKRLSKIFDKEQIVYPSHKLFILLRINHKLTFEEVDSEIDKYINSSKYKGLINFSDSFGLDYYALSNYWEKMEDKYPDVRIIIPDYPEGINELIVDDLIEWLKKFYEKFN